MYEPAHPVPLDRPRTVSISAIENELTQLWKTAEESADDSMPPVVRACTLNLVVVTRDASRLDDLGNLIGEIAAEHPSRVFLISADAKEGEPPVDAWISARCTLPAPGEQQVCCEQITLVAHKEGAADIASIVASLLVPDIPTVLIWKTAPVPGDRLLEELLAMADRALIDSSEEAEPMPSLRAWVSLMSREASHATLGDLAWTHITPWRSILARMFQPSGRRPHLSSINTVTIQYSASVDPRHTGLSQGLLLVGWLSQALGWKMEAGPAPRVNGAFAWKMRREPVDEQDKATAVMAALAAVPPPAGAHGGIESISIVSGTGFRVQCTMSTDRRAIRVVFHEGTIASTEVLFPVRYQEEGELMARELEMLQRDAVYEAALGILTNTVPGKPS